MKPKHALTIYAILWTLLITWACSGCAVLGEIGGKSESKCVRNARIQAETWSRRGYLVRYAHSKSTGRLGAAHKWTEYFKDGRWVRAEDTVFRKRKAYKYTQVNF